MIRIIFTLSLFSFSILAVIIASLASGIGVGILAIRAEGLTWFAAGLFAGIVFNVVGWAL